MYCYIWEYDVKPEHQASFEVLYGPDGAWVALFKTDPNYIRTELFRDRSNPRRYVTVDRWISKEACSSFRKINRGGITLFIVAGAGENLKGAATSACLKPTTSFFHQSPVSSPSLSIYEPAHAALRLFVFHPRRRDRCPMLFVHLNASGRCGQRLGSLLGSSDQ